MTVRWSRLAIAGAVVALLAASQSVAQQRSAEQQDPAQREARRRPGQTEHKFCLSSKLTEMTVKDKAGQACGRIQDLLIAADGQVQYLVIAADLQQRAASERRERAANDPEQPAAEGEAAEERTPATRRTREARGNMILVPWVVAEFQTGRSPGQLEVMFQIDKARLEQAPKFTLQQLSAPQQQAQLIAEVDRFFSVERGGAARPELGREKEIDKNPNRPERDDN